MAPDEVNLPMIRHWVDALDDRNPVYLDTEFAAMTHFEVAVRAANDLGNHATGTVTLGLPIDEARA